MMHEIRETLRSAISALKPTPIALVVDIFGTPVLDLANEFHMLMCLLALRSPLH
jgi:hypothetical protein